MLLNPRRVAAPAAATLAVLAAMLFTALFTAVLAAPGPAGAAKPSDPAYTVETPAADPDAGGYTCTGGRPSRWCAPRGYGTTPADSPSSSTPAYTPPRTVPSPSVSRPPQPELPKTGPRVSIIVGVGILTVLAGWGLLRLVRRSRPHP